MERGGVSAAGARRVGPAGAGFRLPLERLDAVLFDLAGVVVDSGAPLTARDSYPAEGVTAFADTMGMVSMLRDLQVPAGVVTSVRDGGQVLAAAGLNRQFTVVVDGRDAERERLANPPDPAVLLHAAHLLGIHPSRAMVVHSTSAGVQAGCRGGFGLIVGVDRGGGREAELRAYGADPVLTSLDNVSVDTDAAKRRWWQPSATAEPGAEHAGWLLDYTGIDPDTEGIRETLCTLGNGYLASRGAAPESSAGPVHHPGTYLAGLFNRLLSGVHGHTHEDESLVNLPNWLVLQWRREGNPWVVTDGPGIRDHRQSLDLRAGVLHRRYRHVDGDGRATTVVSRMLVCMAAPHLAALETTFTAENWSGTLHVRSAIDGRVTNMQVTQYAPVAARHLCPDGQGRDGPAGLWLGARTSQSRVEIGVATRTQVFVEGAPTGAPTAGAPTAGAPAGARRRVTIAPARPQQSYSIAVAEGRPVRVQKLAAYYTSRDRAITEPGATARQAVAEAGSFTDLLTAHVHSWRRLWERSHVELHTDGVAPGLALNLHTFHLLAATSPNVVDLDAGVGARGLHGEGYHGHIFWDEVFVHRVLALHLPEASRALLLYRWRRLDAARRAAAATGHRGAMFPWQSGSDGREETPSEIFDPRTGRWVPDHTALQRHVGLVIGYSVWQYYQATGDLEFLRTYGGELILEVARFFADLAHRNAATGRYEITGVMGPDEFHEAYPDSDTPGLSNNAYTNVMTVWLLRRALEVVDLTACHAGTSLADALSIGEEELSRWADITGRMYVPWHGDQIISQFDGYADLREFDLPGYAARYGDLGRLDLILAAEGDSPNRYQIGKQADVLMLLYLLSAEEIRDLLAGLDYPWPAQALLRTVDFYLRRVSHGSTLSRVVHAWVQARTDRVASWKSFTEALSTDIRDTQRGTTREGVHLGAMAGTIDLAERCYLGVETRENALWLNPRLPQEITRLHTLLTYRGQQLHVTATQTGVTLLASPCNVAPVNLYAAGQPPMTISGGQELTVPLKPAPDATV